MRPNRWKDRILLWLPSAKTGEGFDAMAGIKTRRNRREDQIQHTHSIHWKRSVSKSLGDLRKKCPPPPPTEGDGEGNWGGGSPSQNCETRNAWVWKGLL